MKTRVLILHTSVGYGIKITAQGIYDRLKASAEFDPRIEDVQEMEKSFSVSLLQKVYLMVIEKISWLWGVLYNSPVVMWIMLPLRKWIASFKAERTLRVLREYQPAMVISTQAAPTGIVAYLKSKGLYRGKLVAAFSDYHLHKFWLFDEVDLYMCNIQEQADQLRTMGVTPDRIVVTGMPVLDKYLKQAPRDEACAQFGLLTSMPVVLMSGGRRGLIASKEIFLRLLRSPKSFQVAVVAGKNEELKEELAKISAPARHPVKILGFVENQDVLMSAASLIISKPGGPTIAEAVSKRLPVIITDAHPGHEEANKNYLVRNGVAGYGRIPREVAFLVEQVLEGKQINQQEQAFRLLIEPKNRKTVVEALLLISPEPKGLTIKNYQA